jgi:putative hydrolase of HD superfamily
MADRAASFEQRVLRLFEAIHPLDRIARAGYVLRGVPEPESVSAHSHFVAVMTLLFVDEFPEQFDRRKALIMALVHDLCEAQLMDVPMPAADAHFSAVKDQAERTVTRALFEGFSEDYAEAFDEFLAASTPEARLVRGLDKAQMMIKVLMYEREHRGRLKEFWANPKNFRDFDIECVSKLFDAICGEAGHARPCHGQD